MLERENMVKSVSRALDIIKLISWKKGGLGVTEIANQMVYSHVCSKFSKKSLNINDCMNGWLLANLFIM